MSSIGQLRRKPKGNCGTDNSGSEDAVKAVQLTGGWVCKHELARASSQGLVILAINRISDWHLVCIKMPKASLLLSYLPAAGPSLDDQVDIRRTIISWSSGIGPQRSEAASLLCYLPPSPPEASKSVVGLLVLLVVSPLGHGLQSDCDPSCMPP